MDETKETEPTPTDTNEGDESKTTELIDDANTAAKRLEKANEIKAGLLQREEAMEARKALGGRSEGGTIKEAPKKQTDTEYAEALERGEVNPLKEDGIFN